MAINNVYDGYQAFMPIGFAYNEVGFIGPNLFKEEEASKKINELIRENGKLNFRINELGKQLDKLGGEIMTLLAKNPNGHKMGKVRDEVLQAVRQLDTDNKKHNFFIPTVPGRLNEHVANLIKLAQELKKNRSAILTGLDRH